MSHSSSMNFFFGFASFTFFGKAFFALAEKSV